MKRKDEDELVFEGVTEFRSQKKSFESMINQKELSSRELEELMVKDD